MFLPLIFLLLACLCVPVMLITLLFVGRQPEPENDSEVPDVKLTFSNMLMS